MTELLIQDPLFLDIIEVFRGVKTVITEVVSEFDLSMSHYVALRILERCGSCTMSELTEHLNVTHGACTGTIDRLERDGFVSRTHSPADRRVVQAALTASGQDLLARATSSIRDTLDILIQSRGPKGRSAIAQGLAEFAIAFRTQPSLPQPKDKACR